MKQVAELKKVELAKIEALEQIVKILEDLEKMDEEAAQWVLEKINE